MKVGIPLERLSGERRVAATPDSTKSLIKLGFEVVLEKGAGVESAFPDALYVEQGATIADSVESLYADADIVLKVNPPMHGGGDDLDEVALLRPGQTLISFLWPAQNSDLLELLRENKVTALAMDAVPRISRAQKLDALSSMANVSGYRAVLEAATHYKGFFPGQVTAAGRVRPAEVLIIGAGVAGLAAIAAARSLGAIVRAFDVRSSVREQVESLGAEFLEVTIEEDGEGSGGYAKTMSPEFIAAEMELFSQQAKRVDAIITTALIPGKTAPTLITKEMVESMKVGSVVVDLAAQQGGNCELTVPHEYVEAHGVHILGYTDLTSRMSTQASSLYSGNLVNLLDDMVVNEKFTVDFDDEVVRGATVTREGSITWPPPKPSVPSPAAAAPKKAEPAPVVEAPKAPKKAESSGSLMSTFGLTTLLVILLGLATSIPGSGLMKHITVFVMACFVGWHVIWNVAPALHTPLMSVTNAISGIIIVGGMLQMRTGLFEEGVLNWSVALGALAVVVAAINIAGGFLVTQRMLKMFRKG